MHRSHAQDALAAAVEAARAARSDTLTVQQWEDDVLELLGRQNVHAKQASIAQAIVASLKRRPLQPKYSEPSKRQPAAWELTGTRVVWLLIALIVVVPLARMVFRVLEILISRVAGLL